MPICRVDDIENESMTGAEELQCCCFLVEAIACNVVQHFRNRLFDTPCGQAQANLKDGNFPLSVENEKIDKVKRHGSKSQMHFLLLLLLFHTHNP